MHAIYVVVKNTYLFIPAVDFSTMIYKQFNYIYMAHVCRPMYCTSILFVKCIYSSTFFQKHTNHLKNMYYMYES